MNELNMTVYYREEPILCHKGIIYTDLNINYLTKYT